MISEKIKDTIDIERNIVKNKGIELEQRVKDYFKHNKKCKEIPFEISKIVEYLKKNKDNDMNLEEEFEEEEEELFEENDQSLLKIFFK